MKTGPAAGRVPISMSFSSSEGVFTARETASHTDWRRVGVLFQGERASPRGLHAERVEVLTIDERVLP